MKTKRDLHTGEVFVPKNRCDQKFASLKSKNAYHYVRYKKLRDLEAKTLKPLLKNHKILIDLMEGKKSITIHQKYLEGAGFDLRYCTGMDLIGAETYFNVFEFQLSKYYTHFIKISRNDTTI
jgi:hypothetical protein